MKHSGLGFIANHKQLWCGLISHKHKQRLEETILVWKGVLRNNDEFMAGEEIFAKQEDHNIMRGLSPFGFKNRVEDSYVAIMERADGGATIEQVRKLHLHPQPKA